MDYSKAFHLVAKASKKSAVPCVLIGGFAVNFYKVTRNTLDVDFLRTKDDFEKIKDVLIEAGYSEDFATDVTVRMSNKKEMLDVDFMIVDDATRAKILKDGKEVKVVRLVKGNDIDFKSDDFRSLCLKYGNEEIYKNILGFLEP